MGFEGLFISPYLTNDLSIYRQEVLRQGLIRFARSHVVARLDCK